MAGSEALEGVTVVEFAGYAAGPAIGKYLANFGARVIHVESRGRPDGFRLQYPPYKEGRVGLNRSGCFALFNDSKLGVTLNLKRPAGLELAHRLVKQADLVIENMRPGVVERLELGYERLRELNPSVVMISTSNMGQTGPYASHPGFGSQLSSHSGFTNLIGEAAGPPLILYGPYIDFVASGYGVAAVLAALDRQRRTGEGAYIDLSQYESGLQFLAPSLLRYAAGAGVAGRQGNRDPVAVPHGCYRARDGRWCVLSCWDEDEWERLCHVFDRADWLEDPRYRDAASRREHEASLNAAIGERMATDDAWSWVERLQRASVHGGVVNAIRDLFTDPQLAARGVWQEQEHPEIGRHHYRMGAYQLSGTPGGVRAPAPCLGQHNREVFQDWLGLDEEAIAAADREAAFS